MSSLSLRGFLNYFGPQRFGLDDKEVNACDIGLAMLQGDAVLNLSILRLVVEVCSQNDNKLCVMQESKR